MNEPDLDRRLLRYLDGAMNSEEAAALSKYLEQDAAARKSLRALAEQAFAVGEAGRCRAARLPISPSAATTFAKTASRRWPRALWWTMAALLIACGAFLAFRPQAPEPLPESQSLQRLVNKKYTSPPSMQ